MRAPTKVAPTGDGWEPIPDPDGRYSSGIPDFDRLLGGGFQRGSLALFSLDETVGTEDLDLLLFPTFLNHLYQSRGMVAILPSRDSPHDFRARLTRFVTRRRFDSRVRICDYVGEDEGSPYVVNLNNKGWQPKGAPKNPKDRVRALAKMVAAEKAVQGSRKKPFVELTAFEVFDTLIGPEEATRAFFFGVKRIRQLGNLGIGLLSPGVGCAAGVRSMADTEFALHRDEVGLIIRGVRPAFPSCVVTGDLHAGAPHVAFVPRPARIEPARSVGEGGPTLRRVPALPSRGGINRREGSSSRPRGGDR
ncbi:MAG TPA: gas vesicle protein GvpD basic region 2 domain-containing protein [Thermoplasmata archaeon]|nr:gas vesicle protein GvpD basic region 2 domain-containing protein [Thermoplasmata archaeon]